MNIIEDNCYQIPALSPAAPSVIPNYLSRREGIQTQTHILIDNRVNSLFILNYFLIK